MLTRIAVGTDGTPTAEKAVEWAIDLAKRYDARLVVISSYQPVTEDRLRRESAAAPIETQWAINPTSDVEAILDRVATRARSEGLRVTTVASEGDPADVLCRFAGEERADIIVVGNKGMQRRLLGSVPNSVTHKAPCSVLVVKTT
jgi:nucleotide-binding universal stress UspA family protein